MSGTQGVVAGCPDLLSQGFMIKGTDITRFLILGKMINFN